MSEFYSIWQNYGKEYIANYYVIRRYKVPFKSFYRYSISGVEVAKTTMLEF